MVHELSRADARRIAVRAQLLTEARPADLYDVVEHLTLLQVSPTDAVAPNADLVLWSRLGSAYYRPELQAALESRQLFEISLVIRPADDVALYRREMADFREGRDLAPWQQGFHSWVQTNDACRRDILERLELEGPHTARELPDTCVKPWKSSGWNDNRNVIRMLEVLERMGEVAV
ncbi:MAG: winged helix DNA-binding domain-containing protein, partial [Frankiaceae bacterium]|nr:winged helix DNA-binding domain-containing protein [Frankiaceae bacterium]